MKYQLTILILMVSSVILLADNTNLVKEAHIIVCRSVTLKAESSRKVEQSLISYMPYWKAMDVAGKTIQATNAAVFAEDSVYTNRIGNLFYIDVFWTAQYTNLTYQALLDSVKKSTSDAAAGEVVIIPCDNVQSWLADPKKSQGYLSHKKIIRKDMQ